MRHRHAFDFGKNGGMDLDWLKAALEKRGITQADAASLIRVSESAMSKIMSGARRLKADEVSRTLSGQKPGTAPFNFEAKPLNSYHSE